MALVLRLTVSCLFGRDQAACFLERTSGRSRGLCAGSQNDDQSCCAQYLYSAPRPARTALLFPLGGGLGFPDRYFYCAPIVARIGNFIIACSHASKSLCSVDAIATYGKSGYLF